MQFCGHLQYWPAKGVHSRTADKTPWTPFRSWEMTCASVRLGAGVLLLPFFKKANCLLIFSSQVVGKTNSFSRYYLSQLHVMASGCTCVYFCGKSGVEKEHSEERSRETECCLLVFPAGLRKSNKGGWNAFLGFLSTLSWNLEISGILSPGIFFNLELVCVGRV